MSDPELEQELDQDKELDDAFAEFSDKTTAEDNADDADNTGEEDTAEPAEEELAEVTDDTPAVEPDELALSKKEIERLNHKYNSDLGRQNALQRKIDEQNEQLQKLQAQSSAAKDPSNSEWDAIKEDYPDIAGAIDARIESLKGEHQRTIDSMRGVIEPIQQQAEQQNYNMQLSELTTAHSDWRDVVVTDNYKSWLNTQPLAVQDMMSSSKAADNIYLLNTYKASQPNNAQSVQQRRQKQLQQAQTVSTRGGRANTNAISDDDFEGAFKHYSSKK